MNTRKLVPLSIAASAALLIPSSITATSASWTDAEWVHADDVGTSSLICGQDTGFESTSYGRFLSGSLLGTSLDPVADLEQMTLALDEDGADISPADAADLGSMPPSSYVYANPFDLSLLSIVGVNLTGFSVPLPGAALGAANQYARVDTFGSAAGASGLINNSGAVQVSGTTPPADLPSPATVRIGQLLPPIAGIADAQLQVGAVAASSVLDGCAALREQLWGIAPSAPIVTRAYGIAGLGLRLDSPAVSALVTNVNSGVSSIQTAVDSLTGSSGVLSNTLGAGLDLALPAVLTTSIGGAVTITGLNLASSVSTLLTTPLTDGVVTVDLQSGLIDVDLDALLPSLNNAAPNTEIVLNNTVLNPIVTRVGTLLDNWSSQVVAAVTAAVRAATVTIDLDAVVAAPGVTVPSVPPLPPLVLPGLNVLNVGIDFTGTIGAVLDGTAAFTVSAAAAGVTGPINTLLAALGLPTVSSLVSTVTALGPTLVTAAANSITTTVLAAITTLGTTLSTAVNAVLTALGSVVNALPSVLSIMVNVQPDQANAPPGVGYAAAGPESTAQYRVSALRLGFAPFATPASIATVTLGTASAGPVAAP